VDPVSRNIEEGPKRHTEPRPGRGRVFLFILIFLIVTTIYVGFHLFIAFIFTVTFSIDANLSTTIYISAACIGISTILCQIIGHFYHRSPMYPLYLLSSVMIGLALYGFLASVAVGAILVPCMIIGVGASSTSFMMVLRVILVCGSVVPVLAGLVNARFMRVTHVDIPLVHLRGKPVKVGFVSDVHLGLLVGKKRLEKIISVLESKKPDMIMIGGDLFDTNPRNILHLKSLLSRIAEIAPTYAVTGNHEFINGVDDCVHFMEELGMTVLRNRAVTDEKTGIQIIGIDDASGQSMFDSIQYDLEKLVGGLDPGKPILFLNHPPQDFKKAAEIGVNLELSGHAHGGQLWPFGHITKLIYKDGDRGLIKKNGAYLFVSMGSGTWGPPIRTGSYSEIAILNLVPE